MWLPESTRLEEVDTVRELDRCRRAAEPSYGRSVRARVETRSREIVEYVVACCRERQDIKEALQSGRQDELSYSGGWETFLPWIVDEDSRGTGTWCCDTKTHQNKNAPEWDITTPHDIKPNSPPCAALQDSPCICMPNQARLLFRIRLPQYAYRDLYKLRGGEPASLYSGSCSSSRLQNLQFRRDGYTTLEVGDVQNNNET
ncbi:hypothetical protein BKA65DRAFT_475114 [Rhexocercosporidium sp. MPI-PUGE-AT-0058]|nr:hypothetical protein BKA65DRAFT_475114 [Rhexocercosporidium sp. MPI-PUGE-AT-0058]